MSFRTVKNKHIDINDDIQVNKIKKRWRNLLHILPIQYCSSEASEQSISSSHNHEMGMHS